MVVGGVEHKTDAHQMAVSSEVHILARTGPAETKDNNTAGGVDGGRGGGARGGEDESSATAPVVVMSVFASLHRKLIVQQVRKRPVCTIHQYIILL